MEHLVIELSPEKFNKAIHGGLDHNPVLAENGDLAIYVKPGATVQGKPMAVITFTVQTGVGASGMPIFARAQATTTTALLKYVAKAIEGWESGGFLENRSN